MVGYIRIFFNLYMLFVLGKKILFPPVKLVMQHQPVPMYTVLYRCTVAVEYTSVVSGLLIA